jgi:hypothetical protein
MQSGFTSFLIIAIAIGLYQSRGWNPTTALFPQVIGFPMLVLLVIILAVDIIKGRRQKANGKEDGDDDREFSAVTYHSAIYFYWLVGFGVLIWAIGIEYSIPIYVFSYLKVVGKYSWIKSGLYAVAATAFIVILFGYVFRVAWPQGALLNVLDL